MTTPAYLLQVTTQDTPTVNHPCDSFADFERTHAALMKAHKGLTLARIDVWKRLDCRHLHLVAVNVHTHDGVWETLLDPLRALLIAALNRSAVDAVPVSAPGGDA